MAKHLPINSDMALLILRIGIGLMFIFHGFPKLIGGVETWTFLGSAMGNLGINFFPAFWGFLAALFESVGGLFFMLGLYFRYACIALASTMFVAFLYHFTKGDSFNAYSHALEAFILFVSMYIMGPGNKKIL